MISPDDARDIAKRAADERGWPWVEPVRVTRSRAYVFFGRASYEIRTNAEMRGANLRIVVDASDGAVLEAYRLPR